MKEFFRDYSYYSVKMFLNQFAIAMLGLTLAMVFGMAKLDAGRLWSSIFAVLFYLFLIYYMTWELGHKDAIAIGYGKKTPKPLMGLYTSLLANSINFILALLFALGVDICGGIMVIIEGMYTGLLALPYKTVIENGESIAVHLNEAWWSYFLIIIPALLISTISYYFGLKDIRFTPLFNEKCTEKPEKKKEK